METEAFNFYGRCRFCHIEGSHRDLTKEYTQNGYREVYYDIFQECFNLYLCIVSKQSRLICTTCVKQLQEANSFRSMVIRAEQDLVAAMSKEPVFISMNDNECDWTKQNHESYVKPEVNVKLEGDGLSDDDGDDDCDDYIQDDDDMSVSINSGDDMVLGELELISRFDRRSLKPLPTRATLFHTCENYVKHLDSLKGKLITSNTIKNLLERQRKTSSMYLTEKMALINNITMLLQHSNMAPFKPKRRSGVLCYYCRKTFDGFEKLHNHQDVENCKRLMKKILTKSCAESLVIYAHVSDLKCTICDAGVENLNGLKTHLASAHKKQIFTQYSDRVVPFKLIKGNEFQCQICGFSFETFGSIERHMNVHYRNYVCDQCGAGYMTKSRLKVHWRYSHETGTFPCEVCKKVFPSQHKFNCHYDIVHRSVKKNKCTKCPLRFADYFNKHKHMVEVHGEPPLQYKCNVCDAVFRRRYALSCHVKRRHLEMRDVQCELCAYKCYTGTELKVHMIKHVGERTYQCSVCKKSYARKKTLKEHMRIHANDRRYVCALCGQGFVQNCSLKGHMRAHHAADVGKV
ncbi:zinc finger protein 624-like [Zerene cesonia]|uniref:zinc finger protein 624-like n=1 Tax=Zerene cesonia TaxID=33412 RepID=UPI0018E55F0D|nr:zinc finger protein 624-like [Zerene cesonia]